VIRAAIRGQAVPKGAIPTSGRGVRSARRDRGSPADQAGWRSPTDGADRAGWGSPTGPGDPTDRGAPDDAGDRLVLPAATEEARLRPANAFPSESELLKQPTRWQRMLRRLPAGEGQLRRAPSARDRERKRALLRFGVLVVIIVLVGGGLWLASVRGRSSSNSAGPGTTTPPPVLERVAPASVAASTQSGSRVADNVVDGKLGTFWSRLVPSDDDQPFLRFSFDQPVELARLSIAAGASGTEFSKRPRPQEIELKFSDGTTLRTTLADKQGFQTVNFRPREVDRLRLVVLSTYPSSGAQRTSISEVRFFRVKG
jgi:hypothetical protein